MTHDPDMSPTTDFTPHQYQVLSVKDIGILTGKVDVLKGIWNVTQELPTRVRNSVGVRTIVQHLEEQAAAISEVLDHNRSTPQVSDESNLFS